MKASPNRDREGRTPLSPMNSISPTSAPIAYPFVPLRLPTSGALRWVLKRDQNSHPPPLTTPPRPAGSGLISLSGFPSPLSLDGRVLPAWPRAVSLRRRAGWLPGPHLAANADIEEHHGVDRA